MTEEHELLLVAESFKRQIQDAFTNKLLNRISRRRGKPYEFRSNTIASGRLRKSVTATLTDSGVFVDCFAYVDNLIFGTPPGAVDINKIQQWMVEKDIKNISGNVAQNIVDRIYKHGSSIWDYNKGQNSGIFEDVNIDNELERLVENIAKYQVSKISEDVFKQLEKLAA